MIELFISTERLILLTVFEHNRIIRTNHINKNR